MPEDLVDLNMLVKEGVIVNKQKQVKEAEAQILGKSVEQLDAEEQAAQEREEKEDARESKKTAKK